MQSRLQHKCPAKATPPGLARSGCLSPPRQGTLRFPRPASRPTRCAGGAGSQDNSGKWPSAFQSACRDKLCEPLTGHSCATEGGRPGRGAGQEEVRRLLSPLTARRCVCSLSPSSPPHSWGKQHGEETGGGHTLPPSPAKLHLCPTDPATCWLS